MRHGIKIVIFIALVFLLVGCASTEKVTEYVDTTPNIVELIQPILQQKPSTVQLIDDPKTLDGVMENSVEFQRGYNDWHSYALKLEAFYLGFAEQSNQTL